MPSVKMRLLGAVLALISILMFSVLSFGAWNDYHSILNLDEYISFSPLIYFSPIAFFIPSVMMFYYGVYVLIKGVKAKSFINDKVESAVTPCVFPLMYLSAFIAVILTIHTFFILYLNNYTYMPQSHKTIYLDYIKVNDRIIEGLNSAVN
ncbi:hypothetical protein [Aliivibrio finisterrensis]|uniref:Uncharacterized protein n=1 Tax=Aliivibrio finisterrensis TaxID=511998 RepID=A0ABY0I9D0_9GAMM|nr:hypothetical protein [Aliivibrio finisterrensis]RYU63772.1 hypothetical protein ERW53_12065 [Aliivibrio finisterrensis]RYU82708.1 hypothetical protein ERW52_13890 [Aliivibrio finisterrensis]